MVLRISTKSIEKIKIVLAYTQQTKKENLHENPFGKKILKKKGKSKKRYIFVTMTCIMYFIQKLLYIYIFFLYGNLITVTVHVKIMWEN